MNSNALNSHALTGIAQGKNVMALLAAHEQWSIIAELINRLILNHPSQLQNSKVILGLAQNKMWSHIQQLIVRGLVTTDELAQQNIYRANVLVSLAYEEQWPLIHQLLDNKLITREQLTQGPNVLGIIARSKNSALISKILDMGLITQEALLYDNNDLHYNFLRMLILRAEFSLINSLIDRGLIINSMLKNNFVLLNLINEKKWEIVEKLIDNHLLTADLFEQSIYYVEDETSDLLWLMTSFEEIPWTLLKSLIANNLITTTALNASPVKNKTFWSHLNLSDVHNEDNDEEDEEDAISLEKRKVLRALIEQDLLNSETLHITTDNNSQTNLLSTIFDIFINNRFDVDPGLFERLIPQITTRLLLESTHIRTYNPSDNKHPKGFLVKLLSNTHATRFIPLLLASPLQPLNDIPWQVFRQRTPAIMVWFWRERRQNQTFSQLSSLGITPPTYAELATFLTEAEQIAWLEKGGPAIELSDYPNDEQFNPSYLPFGHINTWLQGDFSSSNMEHIINPKNQTIAEPLKIAFLKFGGFQALTFLNRYKFSLPSFAAVAPFMSEPSIYNWLLQGNLVLFEINFLANHAPLPPRETIKYLHKQELLSSARMVKIEVFYQKYFSPMTPSIEQSLLGPTVTDFSPSNQASYWQTQIQKKISDLFIHFAFRAADMQTHAALQGNEFPNTTMNIIFSYLLDLSDASISHHLFQKKPAVAITNTAMSQPLIFADQYQELISDAKHEGEACHILTTSSEPSSLLAVLGHKEERATVREDSKLASDWKATKADSNSAFHAIFGVWDTEKNAYICPNILERRHDFSSFEIIWRS